MARKKGLMARIVNTKTGRFAPFSKEGKPGFKMVLIPVWSPSQKEYRKRSR